jgi:hypothetical protein
VEETIDEQANWGDSSAVLIAGMGVANAGETPEILGAVDYQAISKAEMLSITGKNHRVNIRNVNNNTNINQQQQAQCVAACAGGDLNVLATPPNG